MNEIKNGKLVKLNNKWFVEYISEPAGPNNWYTCIPIFGIYYLNETDADSILSKKYDKSVSELINSEVLWKYKVVGVNDSILESVFIELI